MNEKDPSQTFSNLEEKVVPNKDSVEEPIVHETSREKLASIVNQMIDSIVATQEAIQDLKDRSQT
jgi:hypothetical protein